MSTTTFADVEARLYHGCVCNEKHPTIREVSTMNCPAQCHITKLECPPSPELEWRPTESWVRFLPCLNPDFELIRTFTEVKRVVPTVDPAFSIAVRDEGRVKALTNALSTAWKVLKLDLLKDTYNGQHGAIISGEWIESVVSWWAHQKVMGEPRPQSQSKTAFEPPALPGPQSLAKPAFEPLVGPRSQSETALKPPASSGSNPTMPKHGGVVNVYIRGEAPPSTGDLEQESYLDRKIALMLTEYLSAVQRQPLSTLHLQHIALAKDTEVKYRYLAPIMEFRAMICPSLSCEPITVRFHWINVRSLREISNLIPHDCLCAYYDGKDLRVPLRAWEAWTTHTNTYRPSLTSFITIGESSRLSERREYSLRWHELYLHKAETLSPLVSAKELTEEETSLFCPLNGDECFLRRNPLSEGDVSFHWYRSPDSLEIFWQTASHQDMMKDTTFAEFVKVRPMRRFPGKWGPDGRERTVIVITRPSQSEGLESNLQMESRVADPAGDGEASTAPRREVRTLPCIFEEGVYSVNIGWEEVFRHFIEGWVDEAWITHQVSLLTRGSPTYTRLSLTEIQERIGKFHFSMGSSFFPFCTTVRQMRTLFPVIFHNQLNAPIVNVLGLTGPQ